MLGSTEMRALVMEPTGGVILFELMTGELASFYPISIAIKHPLGEVVYLFLVFQFDTFSRFSLTISIKFPGHQNNIQIVTHLGNQIKPYRQTIPPMP